MREQHRTTRQAEDFEYVEDDELPRYLDEIAPQIGWIIIIFNSLEDTVAGCLRELMLRNPDTDESLDVFLTEMMFSGKSRCLIHLYGQMIESCGLPTTSVELAAVERLLEECQKRRNEYAHADWLGMKRGPMVRVKSQSKKRGVVHRYKRFNSADLEEDVDYIDAARDAVYEFHQGVFDQLRESKPPRFVDQLT